MARAHASLPALLAAGLALTPAPAFGNGRFPSAGQILVHPEDDTNVVVRATYGLLISSSGGEPWGYVCEEAVGYGGVQDPALAITKGGTLLAGVVDGLSVSSDGACTWSFVDGPADRYVIDVSTEKSAPDRAVLVLSAPGAGGTVSELWESLDDGQTWTQAGASMPEGYFVLNVDVAPSDPQRVYTSGRFGAPDYAGALLRSDDRGQTWQRFDIPGSDENRLPYLSAVDPNDPDVVYVRLDHDPIDALVVSQDGGGTWSTAFESDGHLFGFALSPDGSRVALGGDDDGIWVAPASSLEFAKVSQVGTKCLFWGPGGLYTCADEFRDGFLAAVSTDEGETFTDILHLQRLCEVLECPETTPVAKQCPAPFSAVQATLKTQCDAPTTSTLSGGSSSGGGAAAPPGDDCGCRAPGRGGAPSGDGARAYLLVAAAAAMALRARAAPCKSRQPHRRVSP